jgi:YesN/AraC family two-component response regulator
VVVLDLDMVTVQNRFFRSLKSENPHVNILTVSSHPYHPHLKEAMTHDICACFRKPLDTEEIEFWLKALVRSAPSRDPTAGPES